MQLDEDRGELMHRATFDHPYPTTKIIWIPDPATHYPDLLATSGDYLRLWRVGAGGEVHQECMLNNVSQWSTFGLITAVHWNPANPDTNGAAY